VLPPSAAFERDIVGLGVAEKQKDKARQVFERSASQAGFFEAGKSKLVMPAVAIKAMHRRLTMKKKSRIGRRAEAAAASASSRACGTAPRGSRLIQRSIAPGRSGRPNS